jgi:hypothetical protein
LRRVPKVLASEMRVQNSIERGRPLIGVRSESAIMAISMIAAPKSRDFHKAHGLSSHNVSSAHKRFI